MSKRLRASALWIAAESTYGTDPDTDGSDYLPVRTLNLGVVTDALAVIPTDYAIGKNHPTPNERGTDGATLTFEVPAHGYAAAGGNGVTPTTDFLDLLLNNFLGTAAAIAGATAAAGTAADKLATATDLYNAQNLAAVWDSLASTVLQWRTLRAQSGSGPYEYTLDRNFSPAAAQTTSTAYGSRQWYDGAAAGASLSAVVQHDDLYFLLGGGRVTSAKLVGPAKEMARWQFAVSFDSNVTTTLVTKTSLPAIPTWTPAAIKVGYSPVIYGGTVIHTKSVEVDFGVATVESLSTAAANGRSDIEVVRVWPTVTINPLFTEDFRDAFRNAEVATLGVQLGGGVLASGVLNSNYLWIEQVSVDTPVNPADDGGQMRGSAVLRAVFNGALSGAQRLWTFARV